jgi:5,10-methylenetetrahydromethanopterin reductase
VSEASVGLVLGSAIAPEDLPAMARLGEQYGFAELWFAEDYFFTGGISGATSALAATERVPIGLGVVSALVRHPAVLAMEVATMVRTFPGRVRAGIGLGVPDWLQQMGLATGSALTTLRECIEAMRWLLEGREVTRQGKAFLLERVRLAYPPNEPVPIYVGAVGPRMLRLAGEIGDGELISVLAGPDYLRWARAELRLGAARARRPRDCPVSLFVICCVDPDGKEARRAVRPVLALYLSTGVNALTDRYGISDELQDMIQRGGRTVIEREMPDRWVEDLAVAGNPEEGAEKIRRLLQAGANSVVLFPVPHERARLTVELAGTQILPRLG